MYMTAIQTWECMRPIMKTAVLLKLLISKTDKMLQIYLTNTWKIDYFTLMFGIHQNSCKSALSLSFPGRISLDLPSSWTSSLSLSPHTLKINLRTCHPHLSVISSTTTVPFFSVPTAINMNMHSINPSAGILNDANFSNYTRRKDDRFTHDCCYALIM